MLYLGGASGTSVSHVSDLVGPEGAVYAVEFSHRRCVQLGEGAWSRQAGLGSLRAAALGTCCDARLHATTPSLIAVPAITDASAPSPPCPHPQRP